MKHFLLYALCVCALLSCSQLLQKNETVEVHGAISDDRFDTLFVYQQLADKTWSIVDTVQVLDSAFLYRADLHAENQLVLFQLGDKKPIPICLGDGRIDISIPANNVHDAVITGSSVHDEYMAFQDSIASILHTQLRYYKTAIVANSDGDKEKSARYYQQFADSKKDIYLFLYKKKGTNMPSAPFLYLVEMYKSYLTDTQYTSLIP